MYFNKTEVHNKTFAKAQKEIEKEGKKDKARHTYMDIKMHFEHVPKPKP